MSNGNLDNILNMMADIERGNVEKVSKDLQSLKEPNIKGMQDALDVLFKVDKGIQSPSDDFEDELDAELSNSNGCFTINTLECGSYSLSISGVVVVGRCMVRGGLEKLVSLLSRGLGFDSPEVIAILKYITMSNHCNKLLAESKERYRIAKASNKLAIMNEEKQNYNDAKSKLKESLSQLSK